VSERQTHHYYACPLAVARAQAVGVQRPIKAFLHRLQNGKLQKPVAGQSDDKVSLGSASCDLR